MGLKFHGPIYVHSKKCVLSMVTSDGACIIALTI